MIKTKTSKSFKKNPPILAAPPARDLEAEGQFQLEVYWCVQQLEIAIANAKVNKQREDLMKSLKTLKSSTAPLIKKRQVMKASFGDYRTKMKEEEKKLALAAKQIKFTENCDVSNKSSFVKKAAILTSGKNFKFNFIPETSVDTVAESEESNGNKSSGSSAAVINNLKLSSEGGFKFNFAIESNDEINLNTLSIKN